MTPFIPTYDNLRKPLRSFYPLYPPALGACLDTSLGAALLMLVTPDVLLLPSNLAPFAKLVQVGAGEASAKVRYMTTQ